MSIFLTNLGFWIGLKILCGPFWFVPSCVCLFFFFFLLECCFYSKLAPWKLFGIALGFGLGTIFCWDLRASHWKRWKNMWDQDKPFNVVRDDCNWQRVRLLWKEWTRFEPVSRNKQQCGCRSVHTLFQMSIWWSELASQSQTCHLPPFKGPD